ncbi:hypothetical protein LIER_35591 [Lithospermum erythrorhizon]|uniref:DUF4283 domain-containing protein n=1 Tax=Lithospermum erythrorhizon TaxID=34254 RepID=A0AAV3NXV7_LITER
MAGGDQPTTHPPPPPTEEVVKQPSPTREVVQTSHAKNPNIESTGTDGGSKTQTLTEEIEPVKTNHTANPTMGNISYSNILKRALGAAHNAEEVEDTGRISSPTLDLKPTSTKEGNPAVVFKASDKAKYLTNMKYVLVGKFSHGRPPIRFIKEFFIGLKLKGEYNISLYDTKHLFIECSLMEDFTRLWMRITWYVKGFPMRMFKWTPEFSPEKESPLTSVWIHFEGLPLYLFEEEPLLSIANSIGTPLRIDHNNINRVKLGQASVCVALDVSQPIRKKVWIGFEDEDKSAMVTGFWQAVHYDPHPNYCTDCCHLGHNMAECKWKNEQVGEESTAAAEDCQGSKQGQGTKEPQKQHSVNNKQFRRVSMPKEVKKTTKPRQQHNTTNEWVKTVFVNEPTTTTTTNQFAVLEDVEENNGQAPQIEKRVQPSNILDALSLPPPSMLSSYGLQPIQLSNCLTGHSLPFKDKSAPPSPTANKEDEVVLLGEHVGSDENQGIMLKEASLPINE